MRKTAIAVSAALVLGLPLDGFAQMGSQMLRNQSRMIERTVSRNLDKVFRPRLVVREGNTGPVTALALSADEHFMVSAVGNNSVRLWDLGAGRELARLSGHADRVTAIAVSPDGKLAASGSADRSVKLWNLRQVGEAGGVADHGAVVTGLVFLDGKRVASADAAGTLKIWAAEGGAPAKAVQAHGPGAVVLAVLPGGRLVSGGADGRVRLWDGAGTPVAEASAEAAVTALAGGAKGLAVGLQDGRILRLDPATLAPGETLSGGHSGAVTGLAFDGEGRLYSGGGDGTVRAWRDGTPKLLGKHDKAVTFIGASQDSGFVLSASEDGTTRLWNATTGAALVTLLSTEKGWAVVDPKGRYDGSQQALNGIDWQGEDVAVNIDSYAETHFEAALLPRVMAGDGLGEAPSIPDGVRYPAKIRFVTPTASGSVEQPRIAVEVEAEDDGGSGVNELRLYRNGRQVATEAATIERGQTADGAPRVVGRFELPLGPGRNELVATAVNADKMESPPRTLVVETAADAGKPAMHLLVVGINAYRNKELNLYYARPDAQALLKFFAEAGGGAMNPGQVIYLEDGKATRENIKAALATLRRAPAGDLVVVYMAGHGVSIGDDWYYVPHELEKPEEDEFLRAQGMSSKDLKAALEAMTADRTLLLLDTCHSGTAVSPLKDYRGLKSLRLLARSVGTHILAATDRDQYAIELARLGHGVFTYAVLGALRGKADTGPADGTVTAAELIRYVENEVPRLAQQYTDYAQYPTGYSRGMDFMVSRPAK
ncbi:caspase family protein [Magnetospirillum sp. UT-4]|uniref:caspase family protein n=1 Tax=Magnetospirillum sp. UT-4 TaxID=2681467 RepID=UPI001385BE0E|nr:caspase family protein [Magnetospirillum sp. UT-4]CAA7615249.1 Wd40 repeat, subgroup [Magnetospirillum sp. UT-4]